jgi:hypothetical protein
MLNKKIKSVESILTNKYFIGIFMIIINIGSRFIIEELTPKQKKYINNKFLRRLFVFCVFFMATKDLFASIVLTLMFVLCISHLFNDSVKDEKKEKVLEVKKEKIMSDIESTLNKNLS